MTTLKQTYFFNKDLRHDCSTIILAEEKNIYYVFVTLYNIRRSNKDNKTTTEHMGHDLSIANQIFNNLVKAEQEKQNGAS